MAGKKQAGYDYLAKILIIGDSGVGKTNILLNFVEQQFTPSHLTTIGIDYKVQFIDVDGKKMRLQVWDTAGQQRFKTITQTYYKGAMGIILTYAINDRETFQNIEMWMKQINQHASENVCKILIGNKSDVPDRQVAFDQGQGLADSYGIPFFETSAKESRNIEESFFQMAKEIKDKILTGTTPLHNQSVKIEQNPQNNRKSGCC